MDPSKESAPVVAATFMHCCDRMKVVATTGLECIADHLVGIPAVSRNRLPQDHFLATERRLHQPGLMLPQLGAALDVGEEKRDGAGRTRGYR